MNIDEDIKKIINKINNYEEDICQDLNSIIIERKIIDNKISIDEKIRINKILTKYKDDRFIKILELTPLSINNPYKNIFQLEKFFNKVKDYLIDFNNNILPIIIGHELNNYDTFMKNNPLILKQIILLQYKHNFPFNLYQILKNNCDINKDSIFNHIDNIAFILDKYYSNLIFDKKEMFEEGMFYQLRQDMSNVVPIEEQINKILNI